MGTPYIALYPTDFLADIGHLGNTELGIYWRLLLVYYRDGKPLPFDQDRLRRLAMAFSPEECRALEVVVAEFFTMTTEPDGTIVWRHRRADIELSRATTAHNRRSEAAKATNLKRWGIGSLSDSPTDVAQRPVSDGEPEPEPEPQELSTPNGVDGPRPSADGPPDVPHQQIIDLYHEALPTASRIVSWTPARAAALRTRWREDKRRQDLTWWAGFFAYIAKSDFLTGRAHSANRQPFQLTLPWLLKAENFAKVREGVYHRSLNEERE